MFSNVHPNWSQCYSERSDQSRLKIKLSKSKPVHPCNTNSGKQVKTALLESQCKWWQGCRSVVFASLGIRPGSTATSERCWCWGRKEAKNSAMTIIAEIQWAVLPREQWFLQVERYAMKGEKPLRAVVCFFDQAAVQRHGRINELWTGKNLLKSKLLKVLAHLLELTTAALTRARCEFALFQSLSRLFLLTNFVKYGRTKLGVEFLRTIISRLERE